MDWNYDLLTPDQGRLLGRLSVCADGWTLEAGDAGWVFVAYAVCVNQQAITGS